MIKYTYRLRCDKIFDECGNTHIGYGIEAVDSDDCVQMYLPDIFLSKTKAHEIIDLFNTHNLSILHLMDAIEDMI